MIVTCLSKSRLPYAVLRSKGSYRERIFNRRPMVRGWLVVIRES